MNNPLSQPQTEIAQLRARIAALDSADTQTVASLLLLILKQLEEINFLVRNLD